MQHCSLTRPHSWSPKLKDALLVVLGPVKLKGNGLLLLVGDCRAIVAATAVIITVPSASVSSRANLRRLPFQIVIAVASVMRPPAVAARRHLP